MQYLSLCFNQKIVKDMHYKSETITEQSYALSSFNSQALDHLSRKRMSKMRVLLMEDNPITQKSILFALDKTVKQLDMASNGREGLDLFFKNKYDLILLDINMPVMDGYEVASRIRTLEQGLHIHIPIIAIISDYLAKDVEKIIEGGIDDFIGKPFKTADLIKKLNLLSNREKE
jgi:CheY-like chemotaxis protein